MTGWVDAHTHLDLPAFDADRSEVLARARRAGVTGVVLCAADPDDWDRVQAVGDACGLPWTLGVHPWWCADLTDAAHDDLLAALSARDTPHGLGETGLDHGRARTPEARARQARSLDAHLELARARGAPVVLHLVRCWPAALRLLRAHGAVHGMVHSWSGPPEAVDGVIELGLHVSFSAAVTRSERLRAAARRVPGERLLVETDAPDQALVPGARGEPADLVGIAAVVAEVRGEPVEALLTRCAANARSLFPALP